MFKTQARPFRVRITWRNGTYAEEGFDTREAAEQRRSQLLRNGYVQPDVHITVVEVAP